MYRIELSPGEEAAIRSIEELAVAIRRGVVTSKARIWHNASNKWLPIQFHPHYKTAATMPLTQADLVVGPPVAPLSALSLPDPSQESRVTPFTPILPLAQPEPPTQAPRVTPFRPVSPYHQPTPQVEAAQASSPMIEPIGSMSMPEPIKPEPIKPERAKPLPAFKPLAAKPQPAMRATPAAAEPARKKKRARPRKPSGRALRVAFIGALLIGGVHVLVSSGVALRPEGLRAQRRLIVVPPEIIKRDSPRTVATVMPIPKSPVSGGAPPAGPTLRTPAPTFGTVPPAADSGRVPSDSAYAIEPAPTVQIPVPAPAATDSLASTVVDSSGKKALKGILKAVSGSAVGEKSPVKRSKPTKR